MQQICGTPPEPAPKLWWSGMDGITNGNLWVDRIQGLSITLIKNGGTYIHDTDNINFTNKAWGQALYSVPKYFDEEIDCEITDIYGHSPLLMASHSQWRGVSVYNSGGWKYYLYAKSTYVIGQPPVYTGSRHKIRFSIQPNLKSFYIDGELIFSVVNNDNWDSWGETISVCGFVGLGGSFYLAQKIYDIKFWWD